MISVTESGNKEKENQYLLKYRESLKSQLLTWNWKLRKNTGRKCNKGKKQQFHYFSILKLKLQAGENHCRKKFQSIPTLNQLENVSGMKHSLLWSTLSKYFHSPELPMVSRSKPPAGVSPPRAQSLSFSLHLSITHHLSAIYQPCFLPISFLKPLAKGCKYLWSILSGILSLALQSFTFTGTLPVLWCLILSTKLSNIQLLQKQVAKDSVHSHSQPTSLPSLPAKLLRACDRLTVVSSHF